MISPSCLYAHASHSGRQLSFGRLRYCCALCVEHCRLMLYLVSIAPLLFERAGGAYKATMMPISHLQCPAMSPPSVAFFTCAAAAATACRRSLTRQARRSFIHRYLSMHRFAPPMTRRRKKARRAMREIAMPIRLMMRYLCAAI